MIALYKIVIKGKSQIKNQRKSIKKKFLILEKKKNLEIKKNILENMLKFKKNQKIKKILK